MKIISIAFSSKMFPTIQGNLQLLLKVFLKINHTPIETAILEWGAWQGVFFLGHLFLQGKVTWILCCCCFLVSTVTPFFSWFIVKKRTFGRHGNSPSTKLIPIVSCFKRKPAYLDIVMAEITALKYNIVLFHLVNFKINTLAQYWNLTGHLQLGVNVQHFAV